MKDIYKIKLDIPDIHEFMQVANSIVNDINLYQGNAVVNAKSLMGLYALDLSKEINLTIRDCDDDEVIEKFSKWIID